MKKSRTSPIVGILEYAFSGEKIEYSNAERFVRDYKDELNYYSVQGVKAILVADDPHLEYQIRKATVGEFGYDVISEEEFITLHRENGIVTADQLIIDEDELWALEQEHRFITDADSDCDDESSVNETTIIQSRLTKALERPTILERLAVRLAALRKLSQRG